MVGMVVAKRGASGGAQLLNLNKMDLSDLKCHSQCVERVMKLTSEASHKVYGLEAMHLYIKEMTMSTKLRPSFNTKSVYEQNCDALE